MPTLCSTRRGRSWFLGSRSRKPASFSASAMVRCTLHVIAPTPPARARFVQLSGALMSTATSPSPARQTRLVRIDPAKRAAIEVDRLEAASSAIAHDRVEQTGATMRSVALDEVP